LTLLSATNAIFVSPVELVVGSGAVLAITPAVATISAVPCRSSNILVAYAVE
jgi:hypothetical protein